MNYKTNISSLDEISLKEVVSKILVKKFLVFSITIIFAISSVIFAIQSPNIYKSTSILVPTNQDDTLSAKLGNLSSLGNFAGISIPTGPTTKSQEGIERIKSFQFFSSSFLPSVKLENIYASESWDDETNTINYDSNLYNQEKKQWVRKVSFPKKTQPSAQEAYKLYLDLLSVNQDIKTAFITISIEHHSPHIAKKWVEIIIEQLNKKMREIDQEQATKSIAYLNERAQQTNIQSIKEAISKLLENQMQTLMLASSNENYVFKTIDPPIAPEERSKPNRALICIIGTLSGFLLAVLTILIIEHRKISNNEKKVQLNI
jgi:uncharacterized protein involved in exopolysaccharide biosynthesis